MIKYYEKWGNDVRGCLIVPIYDKNQDFQYGYDLVESIKIAGSENIKDLYFVFSSDEQKNKFLEYCKNQYGLTPSWLILYDNLSGCKNPVTVKKFFALKQLMGKYDYFAAIDCECVFVQACHIGKLLEDIWKTQSFLASNRSKKGAAIVQKCAETLNMAQNERLIEETEHFQYTWWFNEIPVYSAEHLEEFFSWLKEEEREQAAYGDWNCFDYLIYGIWLIIQKGYSLKKYAYCDRTSIIESLWQPERFGKLHIEKTLETHWTTRVNTEKPLNKNIYLQFHRDRRHKRTREYVGRFLMRHCPNYMEKINSLRFKKSV